MTVPPTGVRVWLANGHTDMRRGMNGLALQVQPRWRNRPVDGRKSRSELRASQPSKR